MAAKMPRVFVYNTKSDLNQKISDVELDEKIKFVRPTSTKDFGNDSEDHCSLSRVLLEHTTRVPRDSQSEKCVRPGSYSVATVSPITGTHL